MAAERKPQEPQKPKDNSDIIDIRDAQSITTLLRAEAIARQQARQSAITKPMADAVIGELPGVKPKKAKGLSRKAFLRGAGTAAVATAAIIAGADINDTPNIGLDEAAKAAFSDVMPPHVTNPLDAESPQEAQQQQENEPTIEALAEGDTSTPTATFQPPTETPTQEPTPTVEPTKTTEQIITEAVGVENIQKLTNANGDELPLGLLNSTQLNGFDPNLAKLVEYYNRLVGPTSVISVVVSENGVTKSVENGLEMYSGFITFVPTNDGNVVPVPVKVSSVHESFPDYCELVDVNPINRLQEGGFVDSISRGIPKAQTDKLDPGLFAAGQQVLLFVGRTTWVDCNLSQELREIDDNYNGPPPSETLGEVVKSGEAPTEPIWVGRAQATFIP